MGRENIVVGLEIGTSKVCAVVGETRGDGTIRILGVGQAPSRGVRKGEIVDFETAGKCIREALVDAEDKSDVMIGSVYLGITGAHIESFNNRGAVNIPEEREEICEEDFEDVQRSAREVSIPAPNTFVHSILQHYYVDGNDGVLNPIGMFGRKLEADFHIIHGVATRIKNSVRCVKEVGPEVLDVVFNPLAAAQVVLDQNQKGLGALVVDMGGGTADYIVYVDGAVKQSGALAIGVCDQMLMLQFSAYSVISPEGCASILWRSADKAQDAAAAMRITAQWANKNQAAAGAILAGVTKIPVATVAEMNRVVFAENLDPATIQPVIDATALYKFLPKTFNVSDMFWSQARG